MIAFPQTARALELSAGRLRACRRAWPRLWTLRAWSLASGVSVSGSQITTSMEATKLMPAATKKGRCQPWFWSIALPVAEPDRIPARAGPRTKPSPKAAPIMPRALERSLGEEESAMAAWATEMLPPVMPSRIRAPSTHSKRPVTAISR